MFPIPIQYYTTTYVNFLLLVALLVLFHSNNLRDINVAKAFNKLSLLTILPLVTFYMGVRPLSGYYFGDMSTYAHKFEVLARGGELSERDQGFFFFYEFCASIMSVDMFFLVCALLYIYPLYIASKRWHKDFAFLSFLALIGSFSFWSYGVNGIRAGLASSFFIWAISYRRNLFVMVLLLLLSVSFHKSMLLPMLAFLGTFIFNKPKYFFLGWLGSIVLSNVMGGFWVSLFASLGFGDERFSGYLTSTDYSHQFSSTGFRWDFLLYSSIAVFVGYMYIYKFKFKDKFYHQVYNTYVMCNAFWIMVIRAAFSNRFAYLSWFLMAVVIIYPLLKHKMFRMQYSKTGLAVFTYVLFTFAMYYILS